MDEASSSIRQFTRMRCGPPSAKSPATGGDSWRSGDTPDLGTDSATPVSDDFGAEDLDHLSAPEERLYIAMARAVVSCL